MLVDCCLHVRNVQLAAESTPCICGNEKTVYHFYCVRVLAGKPPLEMCLFLESGESGELRPL